MKQVLTVAALALSAFAAQAHDGYAQGLPMYSGWQAGGGDVGGYASPGVPVGTVCPPGTTYQSILTWVPGVGLKATGETCTLTDDPYNGQ